MKRTPLAERELPDYTRGEEIFNMVSHIVGAAIAIAITVLCIIMGASHHNAWAVVSGAIYGSTMVIMFTVSSIYHGLHENMGKQVMRVIDHCDIYCLIAGTYTPILLSALRPVYPGLAWTLFGIEWGCCIFAIVLKAIDLERFDKPTFVLYLTMGWAVIIFVKQVIEVIGWGFLWILLGGVSFSIGAVLYALGAKKRYFHSVFHIFVDIGCLLQFFGILFYVL